MSTRAYLGLQLIVLTIVSIISLASPCAYANLSPGAVKTGQETGRPETGYLKCLRCHSDYRNNHHPIDFAPSLVINTAVFPLYDGRMQCLTCHVPDHGKGGKLLRGGPYADRREICFRCHSRDKYSGIDPHIMMDDNGVIIKVNDRPVCLICHARMPNPKTDRAKDVLFRADVAFLCWRCHSLMVSPVFDQHFLATLPANMRNYLKKNARTLGVTIPMVPRNRITCSTCHDPHQKGIIVYEPSSKGADSKDRLHLPVPDLCLVCHRM
ncbi:MAG: hypothetical protein M0Z48_09620 [Nitrospiraceae bacterium]|nr:hypothetical protein [Nitrospiraceae bacterium]